VLSHSNYVPPSLRSSEYSVSSLPWTEEHWTCVCKEKCITRKKGAHAQSNQLFKIIFLGNNKIMGITSHIPWF
jgi:hypothetical protein